MESVVFHCPDISGLDEIATKVLKQYADKRVFAISGAMGAGKTTFVQALCRQMNVADNVNSPTFSIVNEYLTQDGESVFHFDLYRLRKPEELLDIGGDDYFYSGCFCFIEWPEMAEVLIPEEALRINISGGSDEIRVFTIH